ncbi:MAG TPA: hypothetical protein VIK89_03385 [Cytophagaceae bacterium]
MADIRIEKKSKPLWPWILGVLVVIGLVWAVVQFSDSKKQETAYNTEQKTTGEPTEWQTQGEPTEETSMANVNSFVAFINEEEVTDQIGIDNQITGDALDKLSAAMKDLAGDDQTFHQQINSIEQTAQEIKEDPESMSEGTKVTEAFHSASNLLSDIQASKYPGAEEAVIQVEDAAKAVTAEDQLQNQQREIKTFFEESAKALEEMRDQVSS